MLGHEEMREWVEMQGLLSEVILTEEVDVAKWGLSAHSNPSLRTPVTGS
jgi:hypothetical protein